MDCLDYVPTDHPYVKVVVCRLQQLALTYLHVLISMNHWKRKGQTINNLIREMLSKNGLYDGIEIV